ncbi:MAG: hypothetical protein HYW37_00450 [Candidatus Colwellbacteria bacterium]|nr:hypothetical protein [Candidatus Colwellbacteria bacterium]
MKDEKPFTDLTREEAEAVFGGAEPLNAAIVEAVHLRHLTRGGSVHPSVLLAILRREYSEARFTARLTDDGWYFRIEAKRPEVIRKIRDDLTVCLARGENGGFLWKTVADIFA